MSDSELSTPAPLPADDDIERSLRRAVRELNGRKEDVTVNKARSLAETELGLDAGFLKDSAAWKTKSKNIVQDAVEQAPDVPPAEQPRKAPAPVTAKAASQAGRKRKSDGDEPAKRPPKKKARKLESDEDALESDQGNEEREEKEEQIKKSVKKPMNRSQNKTKEIISDSEDDEEAEASRHHPNTDKTKNGDENLTKANVQRPTSRDRQESELSEPPESLDPDHTKHNGKLLASEDDESDMSSLIDEPPAKKKRQKRATTSETKSKSKDTTKAAKATKVKAGKELSADEEEIKKLQGWLVKCGIRKMRWKELAPYPTAKEKTSHLRRMLVDAGMTGRYSNEKAKQIKESRELAEELEAVEEFNERWGQSDEDGQSNDNNVQGQVEKEDVAPKKRLPKGFIDFGDSGDEGSD